MIKKLLALALSLMLAFGFAGCSSDNESDEKDEDTKVEEKADKDEKKADPETEATKTAEAFLDAFVDFDYEGLQAVAADPDDVPEEFKDISVEAAIAAMGEIPEELADFEDRYTEIYEIMIDKIKSECEYEIKDVKEEDGDYVFTGTISAPDYNNIDFESYLGEQLNNEKMEAILMEMFESGEITEKTSEEEMMEKFMTAMFDAMKEAVESIDLSEDVTEEEFELVVVKDGSKWVVDTNRGFFSEE